MAATCSGTDPLARVQRAAQAKAGAEREYRSALVAAVAAGHSYVELAKIAGTSRQAVRQLVERTKHKGGSVTMLTIEARFSESGTGKGVGRWRKYYEAYDIHEARRRARDLVPKAQIRVRDGRETIAGPMLAEEFLAE